LKRSQMRHRDIPSNLQSNYHIELVGRMDDDLDRHLEMISKLNAGSAS